MLILCNHLWAYFFVGIFNAIIGYLCLKEKIYLGIVNIVCAIVSFGIIIGCLT